MAAYINIGTLLVALDLAGTAVFAVSGAAIGVKLQWSSRDTCFIFLPLRRRPLVRRCASGSVWWQYGAAGPCPLRIERARRSATAIEIRARISQPVQHW